MTKLDKAINKLLNDNAVLTFHELNQILTGFGYNEKKTGKTSGSRIAFIHNETKHIIRIHKPHPGNELKLYTKRYIIKELQKEKLI